PPTPPPFPYTTLFRSLEHPAIPRFCASFEEGTGAHVRYYLAQELVAGEALADRLDTHWFSEAEIRGIARQVLEVLVYLQGHQHRSEEHTSELQSLAYL